MDKWQVFLFVCVTVFIFIKFFKDEQKIDKLRGEILDVQLAPKADLVFCPNCKAHVVMRSCLVEKIDLSLAQIMKSKGVNIE